jgi:hypothetical protein
MGHEGTINMQLEEPIFAEIIETIMKNPRSRNILKIEENSEYCFVLSRDGVWKAIPDNEAIPQFLSKMIPIIMEQYANLSEKVLQERGLTDRRNQLMVFLQLAIDGNQQILTYLCNTTSKLLYKITKQYNPGDEIRFATTLTQN